MGWLSGYIYRKEIPITGQAGAGADYQVRLEVRSGSGSDGDGVVYLSGHCIDFPNDIRFTDDDGSTELDHWLEGESGGVAQFWIEIADDLGSNQNFYIYYRRSGAASGSDGQFTFPVFEPFDNYRLILAAEESWDIDDLFSKAGTSIARYMKDVNADSVKELICNVGAESHFAAIKPDGTIVWQNEVRAVKHVAAYYPKIRNMKLYYGDRDNATIYAIDLSDGSVAWSKVRAGLVALNICDKGVVYGATDKVGILDFDDGDEISGWPFAFTPHEQILIAGDLDEDGQDEIVCCNNSGVIKAIDHDGSLMFTITSDHGHVDMMFIADIDPTHEGKELIAVVDDDNSAAGDEGDEIATYDEDGNQLNKYTCSTDGILIRVGNIRADKAGLEVAFCQENQGIVGLLDGELNEMWIKTGLAGAADRTSQLQLADINGDGKLEILTNDGESSARGFYILNNKGELLGAVVNALGWDFDPRLDVKTGEPFSAEDVDDDGKAELMPSILKGDDFVTNNIIYLNGESGSPVNLDGQGLWTTSGASWAIQIDVKKHGTRAIRSGTGNPQVIADKDIVLAGDHGCGFWIRSANVAASSVPLIYLGNNVGSQSALVIILNGYIQAYNGNGAGGGAWVSLVAVANDTWYWVEVLLDQTNKDYDVKVDGTLYDNGGSHFGFRHAPASQGWMRLLRTENEPYNAYVDSIYFRKYHDPEPIVGTAGAEEEAYVRAARAPAYGLDPMIF